MPLRAASRRTSSGVAVASRWTCSSASGTLTPSGLAPSGGERGARRVADARTPRATRAAARSARRRVARVDDRERPAARADLLAEPGDVDEPDGVVDRPASSRSRPPPSSSTATPTSRTAIARTRPVSLRVAPRARAARAAGGGRGRRAGRPGRRARRTCARSARRRRPRRAPRRRRRAPPRRRRAARRAAAASAHSASVTSTSRGSAARGWVSALERLAHLDRVAGRAAEHLVHVGEQRLAGQPVAARDRDDRARQLGARSRLGHERARAGLDVHHERVEPGGELLRQDRGDDQRDRLDRAGRVAQRVEAAVGGRELGRLADDRAAGLARPRGAAARGRARCRSRGSSRACRASRPCGRARGRRSSAPCRRRRRRSARAAARPCRRRRRSSACRAPGPSSHSSTVPERVIAPVSATRSASSRSRKKTAIANAATWPSDRPPSAMPRDEELDLLVAQRARRRACAGSAPAGSRPEVLRRSARSAGRAAPRPPWRRAASARG